MAIIWHYLIFFLPVLGGFFYSIYWTNSFELYMVILLFIFLFLLELGNILISSRNKYFGLLYYVNILSYQRLTDTINNLLLYIQEITKKFNFRYIGYLLIFISLSLIFFLGTLIEISYFWFIMIFLLSVLLYIFPGLYSMRKNYLTNGISIVLLNYIFFFTFYFINNAEFNLGFFAIVFALLLLNLNIPFFLYLADNFLLEENYQLENYNLIKKYNYIYGIIFLLSLSSLSLIFAMTSDLIWLIPFVIIPFIFIHFSKVTKLIDQGEIYSKQLVVYHYWNIKIYVFTSLFLIGLSLLDWIIF